MPYIKDERRKPYDGYIKYSIEAWKSAGLVDGDLTYVLYALAVRALKQLADGKTPNYAQRKAIKSCLNDAFMEFHDRHYRAYENGKASENGDVE